jgi:hypothetical protein
MWAVMLDPHGEEARHPSRLSEAKPSRTVQINNAPSPDDAAHRRENHEASMSPAATLRDAACGRSSG